MKSLSQLRLKDTVNDANSTYGGGDHFAMDGDTVVVKINEDEHDLFEISRDDDNQQHHNGDDELYF